MLKDTYKKSVWNNTDSFVILKPFCLINLIKFLAVFSADLGDLHIIIPSLHLYITTVCYINK